ncbi:MAG: hypothetical protein ACOZNI_23960 [Myxococcota bacterium]
MSDNRRDEGPPEQAAKKPDPPGWFDELREKFADWIAPLLHPPMAPVPVPVRRRR